MKIRGNEVNLGGLALLIIGAVLLCKGHETAGTFLLIFGVLAVQEIFI